MNRKFSSAIFWQSVRLALAAVLAATVVLDGCGVRELASGDIQAPKVKVEGVTFDLPRGDGWPVAVVLKLENPNPQPLSLRGYNCELWIEGQSVAQTNSSQPVNLPALGQTTAMVPIVVRLSALMQYAPMFLGQQQLGPIKLGGAQARPLHYQVAGSFRLASVMGGLIPVPFRFQGQITPQEGMDLLKPYIRNFSG
jgi:LEA14-like dessication related protein